MVKSESVNLGHKSGILRVITERISPYLFYPQPPPFKLSRAQTQALGMGAAKHKVHTEYLLDRTDAQ